MEIRTLLKEEVVSVFEPEFYAHCILETHIFRITTVEGQLAYLVIVLWFISQLFNFFVVTFIA